MDVRTLAKPVAAEALLVAAVVGSEIGETVRPRICDSLAPGGASPASFPEPIDAGLPPAQPE